MATTFSHNREAGEDEELLSRPIENRGQGAPGIEIEQNLEKEHAALEQAPTAAEAKTTLGKMPKSLRRHLPPLPPTKNDMTAKIEKIMESGLDNAYARLSPIAKQEFKIKGEITAEKITDLLRATRVKAKKILRLIMEWLKILPGINKFFLEQEAKIKTDRIIELKNR